MRALQVHNVVVKLMGVLFDVYCMEFSWQFSFTVLLFACEGRFEKTAALSILVVGPWLSSNLELQLAGSS
jgi:hypothetical protein